jgi:hypothetical protein
MPVEIIQRAAAAVTDLEITKPYTAGEDMPANSIVAVRDSDSLLYQAQATTWDRMPAIGVIHDACNAGDRVDVYRYDDITNILRTEDFSYRDEIFVSTEVGKVTKNPPQNLGEIVQTIGWALASNEVQVTLWILSQEIDHTAIELT